MLSAEALIRMSRLESALAELDSIPPAQRSGEVWDRIGNVKLIQGDRLAARRALVEADAREPHSADILEALFELDAATGGLARAQALDRIAKASAMRPDELALALLHGRALAASGRFDEAIARFERAIELDANLIDAYVAVASLLGARGEQYALQFLEQARKERPESGAPDFVLGILREGREDLSGAVEAYERALAREPGLSIAKNNLAWSLTQSGKDLDRALALAQEARRELPLSPEIADTLGYAYLLSGDVGAALPLFLECLGRMQPGNPDLVISELHGGVRRAGRAGRGAPHPTAHRVEPAASAARRAGAVVARPPARCSRSSGRRANAASSRRCGPGIPAAGRSPSRAGGRALPGRSTRASGG